MLGNLYLDLRQLAIFLISVEWISHETMDERLVVAVFHPMVCA